MVPFVVTQVHAIIEGIRLLETFVTAPLGLYSDIKMLRESLSFPEAANLSRDELQERRTSFVALTDSPPDLALGTVSTIVAALDALGNVTGGGGSDLRPEWVTQARRVLARAEQKVAGDMRAKTASAIRGLYVIVDPTVTKDRPVADVAEAALRGGASIVQLRDKTGDKGEILATARRLKAMCEEHGALFVMNDEADVARFSDAHGLHVGQTDLPVHEARRVLDAHQLVGSSNNNLDQAMRSQAQGVDYMGVGAVYPTGTMGKDDRNVVGVELVSKVKELVVQPVVAIGGIGGGNIAEVVRAGADCACVVSAVTLADDPEAATRRLVEAINAANP